MSQLCVAHRTHTSRMCVSYRMLRVVACMSCPSCMRLARVSPTGHRPSRVPGSINKFRCCACCECMLRGHTTLDEA
eukprot:2288056-Prymnesium_polylepis.1